MASAVMAHSSPFVAILVGRNLADSMAIAWAEAIASNRAVLQVDFSCSGITAKGLNDASQAAPSWTALAAMLASHPSLQVQSPISHECLDCEDCATLSIGAAHHCIAPLQILIILKR